MLAFCTVCSFEWHDIIYAVHQTGGDYMDCRTKILELRESTGMNRREFCDYFQIPYRTVTDWERDKRHAPEYVLRLLEYYIRKEGLCREQEGGV
jgi:DNA-binding transcriptional regulator YiaG